MKTTYISRAKFGKFTAAFSYHESNIRYFQYFLTTHFLHLVMLIAAKILFYFNKYYFFCIFLSGSRFE